MPSLIAAYEILSDASKRKQYDQFGEEAFDDSQGGGGEHDFPFNFNDFFKNFDSFFEGDGHPHSHMGDTFFGFGHEDDGDDDDDDEMVGDGVDYYEFFDGFENDIFDDFDFGHHQQHQQVHRQHHTEGHSYKSSGGGGQRCKTVTKRVGNMVSTHTVCS